MLKVIHWNKRDRERAAERGQDTFLLPQFCHLEGLPEQLRGNQRLKDKRKALMTLKPRELHQGSDDYVSMLRMATAEGTHALGIETESRPLELDAVLLLQCLDEGVEHLRTARSTQPRRHSSLNVRM